MDDPSFNKEQILWRLSNPWGAFFTFLISKFHCLVPTWRKGPLGKVCKLYELLVRRQCERSHLCGLYGAVPLEGYGVGPTQSPTPELFLDLGGRLVPAASGDQSSSGSGHGGGGGGPTGGAGGGTTGSRAGRRGGRPPGDRGAGASGGSGQPTPEGYATWSYLQRLSAATEPFGTNVSADRCVDWHTDVAAALASQSAVDPLPQPAAVDLLIESPEPRAESQTGGSPDPPIVSPHPVDWSPVWNAKVDNTRPHPQPQSSASSKAESSCPKDIAETSQRRAQALLGGPHVKTQDLLWACGLGPIPCCPKPTYQLSCTLCAFKRNKGDITPKA